MVISSVKKYDDFLNLDEVDNLPLIEIQGMIANCAIENSEHNIPLQAVRKLVDKFGPFQRVDVRELFSIIYKLKHFPKY